MFKKIISYLVILSVFWMDVVYAMKGSSLHPTEENEERKTPSLQKKEDPSLDKSSSESEEDESFHAPSSKETLIKKGHKLLVQNKNQDETTPLLNKSMKERTPINKKVVQEDANLFSNPSDLDIYSLNEFTNTSSLEKGEEQSLTNKNRLSLHSESEPLLKRDEENEDPDLKEAEKRLQQAEKRPFFVKWVYIDHLLEKMAYSFWLKQENVTGSSPKGCHHPEPLWVEGRGIPLKSGYSAARGITGFRQGMEFVLKRSLSLTLQGLLIYQIYDQIRDAKGFQPLPVLEIIWDGDKQSINGALAFIVQDPTHAPYYLSFFAVPLLWGLIKAGFFAQRAVKETPESFDRSVKFVENFSDSSSRGFYKSLWRDNVRWFLPLHPIDRETNYLVCRLLLDGNLTLDQRQEGLEALIELARNTQGWSKITGLSALQKLSSGTSLNQLPLVEKSFGKDYKEALLREKARALRELYNQNPGLRKAGLRGQVYNLYAHYLRWTLGDFDGWKSALAWTVFKGATLALTINFFVKIATQVINYLKCPEPLQHGFTYAMKEAKYASSYSSQCLKAYLNNFNKVPGQPPETILNILPLFQDLDPNLFTTLNFTGQGVTGAQVGPLIRGLQQKGLTISTLDLSNNNIGKTTDDMKVFLPLPSTLTYLDLSGNPIGGYDENTGTLLGQALPTLPQLQVLKLVRSRGGIGYWGDEGTVAIGNGLRSLTNLQHLDLSWNWIGYKGNNGTGAIGNGLRSLTNLQYLDLSGNEIGRQGDDGIVALGNGLGSLKNLRHLDLSSNLYIGSQGDNGTGAIGNGLRSLTNLQYLDLSGNFYIGYTGDAGTVAIGNGLGSLTNLLHLNLFYNYIGFSGDAGTVAIGNGLRSLKSLQYLDLSHNWIGYKGDNGTVAIGDGLRSLTNLQYLDLWHNYIGFSGDAGTIAIGNGLHSLTNLQLLGLSANQICRLSFSQCTVMDSLIDNIIEIPFLEDLYIQQLSYDLTPAERTVLAGYWKNRKNRNTQTDIYDLRTLQQVQEYLKSLPNDTTTISFRGSFNPRNANVVKAFLDGLASFPLLQYLDLSNNYIDDSSGMCGNGCIIALGEGLGPLTNLQYLDLSRNYIGNQGDDGTAAIGKGLGSLTNLQYLDLSSNLYIGSQGDNGMVAIGKGLGSLTNLQYLDLSRNRMGYEGDNGMVAIGSGLGSLTNLLHLELSGNFIGYQGDNGTVAIGKGLGSLTNLQYLDLSNNKIGYQGDNGTVAIGKGLGSLTNLQYLDLSGNFYIGYTGDNGTVAIGDGLRSLTNLQYLDFSVNAIGYLSDKGTATLAKTLPSLNRLKVFDISSNSLGNNESEALYALSDALSPFLCQGTICNIQDTGLSTLPWSNVSISRGAFYSSQIQRACEAHQCFGTPVNLPDNAGCIPSSASSLSPFPIFKLSSFFRKSEYPRLLPPLLSEDIPMGTEMILYQGIQPLSLWETFKERFEVFSCRSQEGAEFQPSSMGLFFTSAFKGAASTFILELAKDGLEYKGISKRVANRALTFAQAGIIIYMTASYLPTLTGLAVSDVLTRIDVSPSMSLVIGNAAAIMVNVASGDMVSPTSLVASLGGGFVGSAVALKVKDKVSSWLRQSETVEKITTMIKSSWNYMWDMASYFGG